MDTLAQKYIPNWSNKDHSMKFQPWNKKLTKEMIFYAVSDAYASYLILKALNPILFEIPDTPKIDLKAFALPAFNKTKPFLCNQIPKTKLSGEA